MKQGTIIVALMVVVTTMAAYTMKLDVETAQVGDLSECLEAAHLRIEGLEKQLALQKEFLEFQNKLVMPMWLYFPHKPKLRMPPKRERPWNKLASHER